MSYQVCADCDYVIDNHLYVEYDTCPKCDSSEMVDPLDDDRDWDRLADKQKIKDFQESCITLCERIASLKEAIDFARDAYHLPQEVYDRFNEVYFREDE